MWFGAQFAFAWYNQLATVMSYQVPDVRALYKSDTWDSGTVVLSRNPAVADYTDLNFFFSSVYFYTNDGDTVWILPPDTVAFWADPAQSSALPNITTTVDTFAKSLYSLLLSDFGVGDQTNALVTSSGVKWLESQVDLGLRGQISRVTGVTESGRPPDIPNAFNKTGPLYLINQLYQSVVDALGVPLNLNSTETSTVFMQYLCSIPQRKGGGALFFAVLLADLVFLQAVWTLLNLGATWWLQRKYGNANHCDGCRTVIAPTSERKVSDYELLPSQSYNKLDRLVTGQPASWAWSAYKRKEWKSGWTRRYLIDRYLSHSKAQTANNQQRYSSEANASSEAYDCTVSQDLTLRSVRQNILWQLFYFL